VGKQIYGMIKKILFASLVISFIISVTSASVSAVNESGTNGSLGEGKGKTKIEFSTKLESAPLNPDFIKYQKNLNTTQKKSALDGHKTGYRPSPVDLHHLSPIFRRSNESY
jgi:hypothetical protein